MLATSILENFGRHCDAREHHVVVTTVRSPCYSPCYSLVPHLVIGFDFGKFWRVVSTRENKKFQIWKIFQSFIFGKFGLIDP